MGLLAALIGTLEFGRNLVTKCIDVFRLVRSVFKLVRPVLRLVSPFKVAERTIEERTVEKVKKPNAYTVFVKKPNAYAVFVKQQYPIFKRDFPNLSATGIMPLVKAAWDEHKREYRERKIVAALTRRIFRSVNIRNILAETILPFDVIEYIIERDL